MFTAEGGTLPLVYAVGFLFPFLNLLSFTQFSALAKHLITQIRTKKMRLLMSSFEILPPAVCNLVIEF